MIYDYIDTYDHDVHIMIEAKHKELALLHYRELHNMQNNDLLVEAA